MLQYFSQHQANLLSLGVLILTALSSGLIALVCHYFYPKCQRSHHVWDDILLKALHIPVQVALWVYGLTYSVETFYAKLAQLSLQLIGMHFRELVSLVCLFWFLWKYIAYFEQRLSSQQYAISQSHDRAKLLSISRLVRALIILIAVLGFLQIIGIPLSGLLAFGGMGALILGLAAKDLLANFFGGLFIYADRPFTIGDWISSPDKDIEGTVEKIGWRLTTIRRFDKRALYIPNSLFSSITLENASKMTHRRLLHTLGLRYCDLAVVDSLCTDIMTLLNNHPDIDPQAQNLVKLEAFGESSINIRVQAFTKPLANMAFMALQHHLLLHIAACVKQVGADFAFPTQTLDIPASLNVSWPR